MSNINDFLDKVGKITSAAQPPMPAPEPPKVDVAVEVVRRFSEQPISEPLVTIKPNWYPLA